LTASHHSWFGQCCASSWYATFRADPACSARQAVSASVEVKASTWVRPPEVQVPHPSGARPAIASDDNGSSSSERARMRKYSSWSPARSASRIAVSASVAGAQLVTATSVTELRPYASRTTYKVHP
jgi:hypothetical protein